MTGFHGFDSWNVRGSVVSCQCSLQVSGVIMPYLRWIRQLPVGEAT